MYMPDELCWLVPMSHRLPKRVARKHGAYATRRLPYGTPHVVKVVDQKARGAPPVGWCFRCERTVPSQVPDLGSVARIGSCPLEGVLDVGTIDIADRNSPRLAFVLERVDNDGTWKTS